MQVLASVARIISLDTRTKKDKVEKQELPLTLRCGILISPIVGWGLNLVKSS